MKCQPVAVAGSCRQPLAPALLQPRPNASRASSQVAQVPEYPTRRDLTFLLPTIFGVHRKVRQSSKYLSAPARRPLFASSSFFSVRFTASFYSN
jgi:hypothetical protein